MFINYNNKIIISMVKLNVIQISLDEWNFITHILNDYPKMRKHAMAVKLENDTTIYFTPTTQQFELIKEYRAIDRYHLYDFI